MSRFSPQSFERFIQALSACLLGSHVQIYGTGRDGAREASYRGRCRLAQDDWDGYVVIQAKHQSNTLSPRENADWLVKQIDLELSKFEDPKRGLPTPEYYLLATNTRLSAAAADAAGKGEGGVDRCLRHLAAWAKRLGIKDVHLWHADTLGSLLDANEDVRNTFSFWIQPGDVLAALLRRLSGPARDDVLYRFLRKSIDQSRDVKTRDAGETTGKATPLDDVFIDLPVDRSFLRPGESWADTASNLFEGETEMSDAWWAPPQGQGGPAWDSSRGRRNLVLDALMTRCSDKFDLVLPPESETREERSGRTYNRIVLLGGPGQGKSTISQFFAQLCRARILRQTGYESPETEDVVDAILGRAEDEHVRTTGPLRFPFHIELPRYADQLSDANEAGCHLSIISYIASEVGRLAEEDISPGLLRRWVSDIPSVLILDGLDEVPHSGNRAEVIAAIKELLDDIHGVNADALTLVTSRPQGYQDELPRKYWSHWEMEHLGRDDALRFAARLAAVRVSDQIRRLEILDVVRKASDDDATAPLMISPLQITLLFSLVETRNNIPKDRWTLFHRYYEILRDREIAKGGRSGEVIGDHKSQIDRIHYDAGYLLHVRAEVAGSAHAFFSLVEFGGVVRRQLEVDGYENGLEALTDEIVGIATTRLVFLGCRTDEQVAFDVRSLQEFMAAARLTTSPEAKIADRLTAIAGRAHWLHVFKIACSKIYASASSESLRDMIVGVLASLDDGDRAFDDFQVRTGSRLAAQLLGDGLAHAVPAHRRKLLLRALHLLESPDSNAPFVLAEIVDDSVRAAIEPHLKHLLGSAGCGSKAALRLLCLIANGSQGGIAGWAVDLVAQNLPGDAVGVLEAFNRSAYLPKSRRLLRRLLAAQWALSPDQVREWEFSLDQGNDERQRSRPLVFVASNWLNRGCAVCRSDGSGTDAELRFASIFEPWKVRKVPANARIEWYVVAATRDFMKDLTTEGLANLLEAIARRDALDQALQLHLPWLPYVFIERAEDNNSLMCLASRVREGAFGGAEEWLAIEQAWVERGSTVDDILTRLEPGLPTRQSVAGAPIPSGLSVLRNKPPALAELIHLAQARPENRWPNAILLRYVDQAGSLQITQESADQILHVIRVAPNIEEKVKTNALLVVFEASSQAIRTDEFVRERLTAAGLDVGRAASSRKLIKLFNKSTSKRGILPAIASVARGASNHRQSLLSSLNKAAFRHKEGDSAVVMAGVAILRLMSEQVDKDEAATDAETLTALDANLSSNVLKTFEHLRPRIEAHEAFKVTASRRLLQRNETASPEAYRALYNFVEAQKTRLDEARLSEALDLPTYSRP